MTAQQDIYAGLTAIFRKIFRDDGIVLHPDSTPDTITGWDSFKYVTVLMEIEQSFAVELDGPELDTVRSVGELVALIEARSPR